MIENMLSHANPFHVRDEVSPPAAVAPRERDGITRRISAASSVQQRPMPLPPCCCWHCGSAPTRAQRARSDPSLPARAIVCRQVTTSDYITLIALGLVLPMAAVWMQNVSCCCALSTPDHASVSREAPDSDARTPLITSLLPLPPQLVDTWAKGTPIKRGDPRYFHVPEVSRRPSLPALSLRRSGLHLSRLRSCEALPTRGFGVCLLRVGRAGELEKAPLKEVAGADARRDGQEG